MNTELDSDSYRHNKVYNSNCIELNTKDGHHPLQNNFRAKRKIQIRVNGNLALQENRMNIITRGVKLYCDSLTSYRLGLYYIYKYPGVQYMPILAGDVKGAFLDSLIKVSTFIFQHDYYML